ncbi:LacI family DNA-binding transcriptional regulator [Sphingomonas sp.]|uniref:LacI family DNA-binding transcriptional regulator n=1 Tax=Sphingomonas sp. TaxID=28214 RepID=UPI00286B6C2C|nr:LacI family DNA-binding transcriptional regulator [Sphingomonas sp.]
MGERPKLASVTIEDVARSAGVSRQTVSRVINRSPNVKPVVRARIEAAIEQLRYVPNLSARRMGGGRSYLILAISDRGRTLENWQAGRGNDWVDQMLFGGMTACEAHGYHMLFNLVETDAGVACRKVAESLSALRPDGVILTPSHSKDAQLVELLAERRIACATINSRKHEGCVSVTMDEAGAAREATRHLLALGHRRIAFLAGSSAYGNSALRLDGFEAAMADDGASAGGMVVRGDFHFERAAEAVSDLLRAGDRPTAIIAENDEMSFAVLHVANRLGLAIPADLSLISFEDTPGVRFSVPPLTAIRQPIAAMIGQACEKLIAIRGGAEARDEYVLPYELVVRSTTAPPRA